MTAYVVGNMAMIVPSKAHASILSFLVFAPDGVSAFMDFSFGMDGGRGFFGFLGFLGFLGLFVFVSRK